MGWSDADLALLQEGFLVSDNPLATREQRDLERLAVSLFNTQELASARTRVAQHWLGKMATRFSEEQMASFDRAVARFVFHCCLNAANSDAGQPKVLKVEGERHRWFGMDVPGAERGGNNADCAYRILTVDGEGRFEVLGRAGPNPPADVTFTLIAGTSMSKTIQTIEWRDVVVEEGGLFRLTVDPEPANGRPNHLRSRGDASYIFVRDCLTDWQAQRANRLAIRRLDAGPPPPSREELIARAARYADTDMAYYWDMCMGQSYGFPVNTPGPVRNTGQYGGLVSQSGSTGHYRVADDEALVITVTPGSATYMSFMVHDPWWCTLPFAPRTASLNLAQIVRDADGAITFVTGPSDPGVHNWIDTGGVHEGIFYFRWQGLPADDPAPPEIRSHALVKLDGLREALPAGTRFVTAEERKAQQDARARAVAGWWRDR